MDNLLSNRNLAIISILGAFAVAILLWRENK